MQRQSARSKLYVPSRHWRKSTGAVQADGATVPGRVKLQGPSLACRAPPNEGLSVYMHSREAQTLAEEVRLDLMLP